MRTLNKGAKRILLADDEPDVRELIKQVVALDGHLVTEASDAAQALSLFFQGSYDLVITDFEMPKMKVDELVNEICRLVTTQRIIMVSANAHKLGDSLSRPTECINRPFLVTELREAVRRVLDNTSLLPRTEPPSRQT
jgi:CheY-like chemotaxis protein